MKVIIEWKRNLLFFSEEDVRHEEKLNFYLYNDYTCHIHSVSITESSVRVTGEYTGEGNFFSR